MGAWHFAHPRSFHHMQPVAGAQPTDSSRHVAPVEQV
jgi:hypothetical protein